MVPELMLKQSETDVLFRLGWHAVLTDDLRALIDEELGFCNGGLLSGSQSIRYFLLSLRIRLVEL